MTKEVTKMAGRPTKEPGEKMDVPLKIMLTATQDELIRQVARVIGADVSAWARAVLLREASEQKIVQGLERP
jgi:hypothetical protein